MFDGENPLDRVRESMERLLNMQIDENWAEFVTMDVNDLSQWDEIRVECELVQQIEEKVKRMQSVINAKKTLFWSMVTDKYGGENLQLKVESTEGVIYKYVSPESQII